METEKSELEERIIELEEQLNQPQSIRSDVPKTNINIQTEAEFVDPAQKLELEEQLTSLRLQLASQEAIEAEKLQLLHEISRLNHQIINKNEELELMKSIKNETLQREIEMDSIKEEMLETEENLRQEKEKAAKFEDEVIILRQREEELLQLEHQNVVKFQEEIGSLKAKIAEYEEKLREIQIESREKKVFEEKVVNLQKLLSERDEQLERFKTMMEGSPTEVVELEANLHKGHKKGVSAFSSVSRAEKTFGASVVKRGQRSKIF